MDAIFQVSGLFGGYGGRAVIKDASFDIIRGKCLGIIGPNGSGKSTLLRLMTRVIKPSEGKMSIEGRDVAGMDLKAFAKKVAFVPQDTVINFEFSVLDIVLMGRIPHLKRMQFEARTDFSIAENALQATDTIDVKDRPIDSLSAGERQRVVIAKALAQEPSLLFLDEPTSHLDIGHQILILDLLKRLMAEKGLTIAIVMHDLNLASEYCDSLMLLDKGRIFKLGPPEDVLTYQNIEAVYKTVVIVNSNPVSLKPYIIPVSGKELCIRS